MKLSNRLILTTSPRSPTAKKPRGTANLVLRQRPLYGRKRHYHAVKERDSETGLYYYGARYLDSKTSRWISGDPAMGEYVPSAPVDDEARKKNQNLPGMGGVFNYVNLHVYHYAGNNPVKYVDPDGNSDGSPNVTGAVKWANSTRNPNILLAYRVRMGDDSFFSAGIPGDGPCLFMAYLGVAQTYANKNLLPEQVNELFNDSNLFSNNESSDGDTVIKAALQELGVDTSNLDIDVVKDNKVIPGAFATIREVGRQDRPNSTVGHYQERTGTGEFKWDPKDSTNNTGRKEGTEIRNVFITTKPLKED